MHARVTRMWLKDGAAAQLVDGGKAYMAAGGDQPNGWIGALLLLAEDNTQALSVTLWSSAEALARAEAGDGFAAVMQPFAPLFSRPYERVNMAVGATTLVQPGRA
ncbi:MAG: hypothetical protein EXQ94_09360 [Alphaproteobacteria bacterium]|nr:hypothetical protein [Alphaproteobacteria bacterium]